MTTKISTMIPLTLIIAACGAIGGILVYLLH